MSPNNFRVLLGVGLTHLRAKPKQTIIAALGVTFGIAMFIVMISFMTGVNELLENVMLSVTPHVRLYNDLRPTRLSILHELEQHEGHLLVVHSLKSKEETKQLKAGKQVLDKLRQDPRVLGVTPQLQTQLFFISGAQQVNGALVGVDILEEDKLFQIGEKMAEGNLEDLLTRNNAILMGSGLAGKLNVALGDNVTGITPQGTLLQLKVVGIFQTGLQQLDDTRSYASLATAQKALGKDRSFITDINLKLHNANNAKTVMLEYSRRFDCVAMDWETANASALLSIQIRNIMTTVITITLLVVAGFGIYNIMNMTIYEKMRDIAILKATGFNGRDVTLIFLFESIFLGLMGALVGIVLGYTLCYLLSLVPFNVKGFINIDTMPVAFHAKHYAFGFVFGLLTTALAGYLPARKAARVDPVLIIRGN